jgi:hypothetical protein
LEMECHKLFALADLKPLSSMLPISASQVARITGVRHSIQLVLQSYSLNSG